jgi:hypothetical protein
LATATPVGEDDAVTDLVLERRIRIARLVRLGKRIGYGLFLVAIIAFFFGFATTYSDGLVSLIGAALIIGSLVLAPAIVMGYAVRSAHREDHELGRLDGDA